MRRECKCAALIINSLRSLSPFPFPITHSHLHSLPPFAVSISIDWNLVRLKDYRYLYMDDICKTCFSKRTGSPNELGLEDNSRMFADVWTIFVKSTGLLLVRSYKLRGIDFNPVCCTLCINPVFCILWSHDVRLLERASTL